MRGLFIVFGDTRPAAPDDTGNYPSAIISTGDYQFASTDKSDATGAQS